jgi:hypothetical protein
MKNPLLHTVQEIRRTPQQGQFDEGSVEGLLTSGRFSNVANAIEDTFGWLFGGPSPTEFVYDPMDDLNRAVHSPGDPVMFMFAVNEDTLIRLQRFVRNEIKINDSFITAENVNIYLAKFWNCFGSVYPIIHRPTFDPNAFEKNNLNTYFLLSMITISMATMGPKSETYQSSVDIQRGLRGHLHHLLDFTEYDITLIPLKLLQSLLLSDIFHLYYGDAQQHVKFNIYHPLVVNVLKEMKAYVNLAEPYIDQMNIDFEKWSRWIRYESMKRITFFAYILDTQGSFFLGTTPSTSVFDIQLELPYTDSVWTAPDIIRFGVEYRRLPRNLVARKDHSLNEMEEKRYQINKEDVMFNGNLIPNVKGESRWPNFLWSLRRLMQPFTDPQEREYHFNCFSQFSRFVFLHGVLSLVRELRTRSIFMFDNKEQSHNLNTVAAKIEHAFFSWRSYFHTNISEANAASLKNGMDTWLNTYDTSPIFWANITLLNCGLMGLYCNFGMVVQYSKTVIKSLNSELSQILINSPGKLRFDAIETTKNKILVLTWSKSKDGEHALVHACLLLQTILTNQDMIPIVPHAAYAMYLATLICWAQQQGTTDQIVGTPEELVWETHKERAYEFVSSVLRKEINSVTKLQLRSLMLYVVFALQNHSDPNDIGLEELSLLADTL